MLHALPIGKGRKLRTIQPLSPEAIDALRMWRKQQSEEECAAAAAWHNTHTLNGKPKPNQFAFTYTDGQPLHPRSVAKWFEEQLADHELRRIGFHGMRHTHAAVMLTDWDLVWVSRRLGHASVEITDRTYGHMLAGAARRFQNRPFVEIVRAAASNGATHDEK